MKRIIVRLFRSLGYDLVRYSPNDDPLSDLSDVEKKALGDARPFTMTSLARMAGLVNAVNYIVDRKIPGDIAECGVWQGGSMMVIAKILLARGDRTRSLYLYDTFEGMPPPSAHDKSYDGVSAARQIENDPGLKAGNKWCYASLEDVRANLLSTGYPAEKLHFIKGKVEDTIPKTLPSQIAILRLDTDWYESTKHELVHLYPLLNRDGVLVIDDYGHWQGAKKAVDEYFANQPGNIFLHRIDNTGRATIKR
jgi:O-methyltransferase